MSIGVVKFDDPSGDGPGWASYDGQQARRINSIGDLETSRAWIVDMGYYAYMNAKLWQIPHIKRMDYLRVKPAALATELRLGGDPREKLETLSAVYSKSASILVDRCGLDLHGVNQSAAHALKQSSFWSVPTEQADAVAQAVRESTQESQNGAGKTGAGTGVIGSSFPRSGYAAYLMSLPVPKGPAWNVIKLPASGVRVGINKGQVVKGGEKLLASLAEQVTKTAMFLEVSVLGMPAASAKHSTFGNGANHPRRWATLPEILFMSKYAHLELRSGFGAPLEVEQLPEYPVDPSISGGIVSEVMWVARTLPPTKDGYNPVGAYLRAYDRIACGTAAMHLSSYGYQVASYGTGRVYIYANPQDANIDKAFLEAGLLPRPTVKRGAK